MEQDTLQAILAEAKKEAAWSRITALIMGGMLAVVLVAALILVPRMTATLNQVNATLTDAQTIIARATEELESLSGTMADVKTMTASITATSTSMKERLDAVDLEALNEAITGLKTAVEPLANFARRFGGQ